MSGNKSTDGELNLIHFVAWSRWEIILQLDSPASKVETADAVYDVGTMLFAFLRYLASEQFAHAAFIRFRLGDMLCGRNVASIFTHPDQWSALNAVSMLSFFIFKATMKIYSSGHRLQCVSTL